MIVGLIDIRSRIIGVADRARLVDNEDAGGEGLEQGEAVGFDAVQLSNPGTLVAEDGVRILVAGDILADQLRPVRDEDEDFRLQSLELGIVMAQLRYMVGAVRSGKADVEDQEDAAGGEEVRELEEGAFVVREAEVWGWVANG